jgi:tungstate transport system substrate-binding protein
MRQATHPIKYLRCLALGIVALWGAGVGLASAAESIILQSTTSTANSGLYDAILPQFTDKTGIQVNVVAVGTGQAIKNAENGDGDVLLVHAKPAEEKFVADGFGVERFDVMYNDFIIVGPAADPAKLAGSKDATAALKTLADSGALFASRGDNSGTHKKELALWKAAGVDPTEASGQWYRETGSGMGATLNAAVGMGAYTLTDRGTWISFGNKGDYEIVVEGDPILFNQYGVILVNPDKHPKVKTEAGQAFIDWILSDEGQAAIAAYQVDGQQLFYPNYRP